MRAGEIAGALRAFAAERAPAGVVLALAACLCAGPWALADGDGVALARAVAVVFALLLALRIADDLVSLRRDRIAHPERGLPSGRIAARPLGAAAAALFGVAAVLGAPRLLAGAAVVGLFYAAYFALEARIPLPLRPPLVDAVFAAIPLGTGLLAHGTGPPPGGAALLAPFFWLAAVGHDYAHDVHAPAEALPGVATCSGALGPRPTAVLGAACYAGAFAIGLVAARAAHWPPLFVVSLILLFGHAGTLLARLVARPGHDRARRLYIAGMACFALPSLLLAVDRIIGW